MTAHLTSAVFISFLAWKDLVQKLQSGSVVVEESHRLQRRGHADMRKKEDSSIHTPTSSRALLHRASMYMTPTVTWI